MICGRHIMTTQVLKLYFLRDVLEHGLNANERVGLQQSETNKFSSVYRISHSPGIYSYTHLVAKEWKSTYTISLQYTFVMDLLDNFQYVAKTIDKRNLKIFLLCQFFFNQLFDVLNLNTAVFFYFIFGYHTHVYNRFTFLVVFSF